MHSRFRLPIELTDTSTCKIKKGTHMAELLTKTYLIIWDEVPMSHRYNFKALDRTLRDILSENDDERKNLPFGRMIVVLGGDFRQILLVIPKGRRSDIIQATINSSDLWPFFNVRTLTENMRLSKDSLDEIGKKELT